MLFMHLALHHSLQRVKLLKIMFLVPQYIDTLIKAYGQRLLIKNKKSI